MRRAGQFSTHITESQGESLALQGGEGVKSILSFLARCIYLRVIDPSMKRLHVATIVVLLLSVSLAGCTGGLPAGDTPQDDSIDQSTPTAEGTLQVHYIAVGQAAGVLVIGPEGETMLIDSGHFNDDGEYVIQYLEKLGNDRLD